MDKSYDLNRFLDAQQDKYLDAVQEIRQGKRNLKEIQYLKNGHFTSKIKSLWQILTRRQS